ncbi:TSUP family transporter [Alphaproteobacteria bacterium GH1-50]|uniref:Probable membrane transporter protein n=1 Tax=Kangsaoukella pontilimi TaxID=2691042 RepID=A0A7C9MBR7_9RHOB|nr:sulfite exporter TauE/SafE family protein [Kangsaoukella pontilimi]MXQ07011.1 TSUP family transporter [Kangsaoukella pontilimi]
MPDVILSVFQIEGVWYLILAALMAGVVRGFAGFGTAMVYLPVAGQVLGPFEALTTLVIMDLTGPLIHVPRALKDGHPGDVARLGLGALISVPLGVWVLSLVEPEVFRYGVSLVAIILLVLLIGGVRYRGELTRPMIFGTGALGGFLGGSVGLPGPPVIMLYMASALPPKTIRANNTLYLSLFDAILIIVLAVRGFLRLSAVTLGLVLILPYTLGNWIGARIFRPEAERMYRFAAYLIIAVSALHGLPLWD